MPRSSSRHLALCLVALLPTCGRGRAPHDAGTDRLPSTQNEAKDPMSAFDDVRYGGFPSSCSPRFAKDEPHGIKLAIPPTFDPSGRVGSGERAKLPLCLTLKFDALYLSRFEHVFKEVKVVLVDDERGETFTCGVWRDRFYAPKPPRSIPPEELEKRIATEYRTVDLLEHVKLPPRKATYKVYAVLEQHKSNVATIRVEGG